MDVTVRFVNFWPSFSGEASLFVRYLLSLGVTVSIVEEKSSPVDLEFVSVFPSRYKLFSKKFSEFLGKSQEVLDQNLKNTNETMEFNTKAFYRIWFTGENIRPPLQNTNINTFLSYDQDTFNGRNVYFPLWLFNLDWFSENITESRTGLHLPTSGLTNVREEREMPGKLACAFIANRHPFRFEFLSRFEKYGQVDIFGKSVGRPVRHKAEVAKDYKYVVCFENDLYPGYVTEKLLDAYACGTIPIYWGDLGQDSYFNRESFFNLKDFVSMDHLIEKVLDSDYNEKFQEPLFQRIPSLDDFSNLMQNVLADLVEAKKEIRN